MNDHRPSIVLKSADQSGNLSCAPTPQLGEKNSQQLTTIFPPFNYITVTCIIKFSLMLIWIPHDDWGAKHVASDASPNLKRQISADHDTKLDDH